MFGSTERSEHRFLDHERPIDAPLDGKNLTARADVTPDGYCVEYRESLKGHFNRVGQLLHNERVPRLVSDMEIGMKRGLKMYGFGMCGAYGNQTKEKPWFGDIIGVLKWNAWEEMRGAPEKTCQKMFIKLAHEVLIEYNYGFMIEQDPRRPGPDYYNDCIKFNWVDALVGKHKENLSEDNKNLYKYNFDKEDDAAWQILQERNQSSFISWSALTAASSAAYISFC